MIYNIREYTREDTSAMRSLWSDAFGDPSELIDRFFELLPSMGTGFVAELDGEIFGAAYVLDAFLHLPGGETKKLAYIYAVSVDESAQGRGIGAELTRACMRNAWDYSADICCTLPAEDSLYDWYESRCGLAAASYCNYESVSASSELDGIRRLSADEYGFLREGMLNGHAHVSFYYGYLRFQEEIFTSSVGGFFEYQGGLVCGYVENGIFYVKESLGDTPEFIPALCASLGAGKAVIRRASAHGERYIAAYQSKDFPPDTVWNLTLD